MTELIQLDGSKGGGQVVRTALGLSVLTGKGFSVSGIRAARPQPGLKAQHLTAVRAFEDLCDAEVEGAELGSMDLKFVPGEYKPRTLSIDIGTAGSITLLLQALVIPAMLANGKTRFRIKGGTNVAWSMPAEYMEEVLVPQLRKYADIEFKVEKRGYYPKGGGRVDVRVVPKHDNYEERPIPGLKLVSQGHLIQIKGIAHANKELAKGEVAERMARAAKNVLRKLNVPVRVIHEYCETSSVGCGVTLWAVFSLDADDIDVKNPIVIGADSLGEKGKKAEKVGEEAAKKLLAAIESKAPVDSHLADNLIPYLGLFGGQLKVEEVSEHTLRNIEVVEKFLGKKVVVEGTEIGVE